MGKWFVAIALILSSPAFAKFYKYSELQIKDHDEMLKMIQTRVKASKKAAIERQKEDDDEGGDKEAVEELREAARLALSRPNKDNLLNDLIPPIRHELTQYNAYDDVLVALADEATGGLGNQKLPTAFRCTYLFMLENLMSEMKPELATKAEFRRSLEKIRDAKIKIEADMSKELRMTSMFVMTSPSETAKKILAKLPPPAKTPAPTKAKSEPEPEQDRKNTED